MSDITIILNELYQINPELKQHEVALKKLLTELEAARPEPVLDDRFRQRLRAELIARAAGLDSARTASPLTSLFTMFTTMPKFSYAVGGLAVVVVAAVTALALLGYPKFAGRPTGSGFTPTISRVGNQAFGNLAAALTGGAPGAPAGLGSSSAMDLKAPAPTAPQFERAGGDATVSQTSPSALIYPYYPQPYQLAYRGEPLTDLPEQVDVLRRITGPSQAPAAAALLRGLSFPGLNLASFSNLSLAQLTLNQDQEYGYSLYLDLISGTLSVNQNWLRWPQPFAQCQDQVCYDRLRLSETDMLDETELIALAREFMLARGFALENYGQPYVVDDWRTQYQRMPAADRAMFYFPETVTVLFPLVVDGREVYEGGHRHGVGVGVSLRDKRVSGLWNATTQQYQASSYPAVTDAAAIITQVESGSPYGSWPMPMPFAKNEPGVVYDFGDDASEPDAPPSTSESIPMPEPRPEPEPEPVPEPKPEPKPETDVVVLGTPTQGYLKVWSYTSGGYTSDELLVPALVFPITHVPEGVELYQGYVVVPLVKDFWEQTGGGPIRIMPAEPNQGSGATGSAGAAATEPAVLPQPARLTP